MIRQFKFRPNKTLCPQSMLPGSDPLRFFFFKALLFAVNSHSERRPVDVISIPLDGYLVFATNSWAVDDSMKIRLDAVNIRNNRRLL